MVEHDTRLVQIEKSIGEIKDSLHQISVALLGSYDKQSVGLIEECRTLRREVDDLKIANKLQEDQINTLLEFKKDAKKIVAAIAVAIPFIFEVLKAGFMFLWNGLQK
jgi:hypothetical protein